MRNNLIHITLRLAYGNCPISFACRIKPVLCSMAHRALQASAPHTQCLPVLISGSSWLMLLSTLDGTPVFVSRVTSFPDHLSGKDGHSHSLASYTHLVIELLYLLHLFPLKENVNLFRTRTFTLVSPGLSTVPGM